MDSTLCPRAWLAVISHAALHLRKEADVALAGTTPPCRWQTACPSLRERLHVRHHASLQSLAFPP